MTAVPLVKYDSNPEEENTVSLTCTLLSVSFARRVHPKSQLRPLPRPRRSPGTLKTENLRSLIQECNDAGMQDEWDD